MTTLRLIGTGDSIMIGKHAGNNGFLPHYQAEWPGTVTHLVAESGSYIQFVINNLPTIRAKFDPNAELNVVLVNTCTNNINNANAANWTEEAFAQKLIEHMGTVRDGILLAGSTSARLVINTVIARRFAGGANVQRFRERIRLRYNELLRETFPNMVCDLASLPGFLAADDLGTPANPGLYVAADLTHLLVQGYDLAAPVVNAAVDSYR